MSYRLSLLRSKLSSLKATVTHHMCLIISFIENVYFAPLRVELGPLVSKLKEQLSCAVDWSLIGMKQFYMPLTKTQKSEQNVQCKVSRLVTKPTKWVCAQRRLRSAWASAGAGRTATLLVLSRDGSSFFWFSKIDVKKPWLYAICLYYICLWFATISHFFDHSINSEKGILLK